MLRRALVIAGLALSLATCRDALEPGATVSIAVAPVLPSEAELAAFGLTIDAVRFVVVRPPSDTLADTTVALPPDLTELALDIRVPLLANPETLSVSVVALGATIPLFTGTTLVQVPTPLPPPEISVTTYIGPVVDSIVILPRSPFIPLNDSLRLQVQGFNAGVPVTQFFVAWSTSDSALARINHVGTLRAPATRASVWVRARTPSGAADSVTAAFVPAATQLVAIAGGGQSGLVGALLPMSLEVETRAADGFGVGGVPVRFRPLLGGGLVADTLVVTDAAGRARTTATLGSLIGANTFEAAVAGLAGSPITFSAIALSAPATRLLTAAGDVQTATVGTAVPIRPAVRVEDSFGNPVAGVSVTFAASGGGSVVGASQLTNAGGVATVGGWTLGTIVGANALMATVAGVTPVTFTATGLAGAAATMIKLPGDSQAAVVNTAVPIAPRVRIEDQFGNRVTGVSVSVAVTEGSGLVTISLPVTDTAGVASVGSWQLGTLAGQNALTMSVSGLAGSPATFTASGLRDVAAQLVRASIDTQTAIAGQPVSVLPAVRVTDQYGNAVPGHSVTFALTGALMGTHAPPSTLTDTGGVARVTDWTVAVTPGLNTLDAAASGLSGSPISFSADGITTTASTIVATAGDAQSAVVATLLPIPYAVEVRDAGGLPVQNVQVHWAVGTGGGSMNPATSQTDANGIATSARTLGLLTGTQTATASVGALTGSPVTFTATALPDVPAAILRQSPNPQAGTVATAVVAPIVKVVDQHGNGVAGVIVGFAGGGVGATADTTDGPGFATAGTWTLGQVAGLNTVTVSSGTLPTVGFTATGVAGAPAQLAFLVEPAHGVAGNTIAPAVEVALRDQFGNLDSTASDVVTLDLAPPPPNGAKLVGGPVSVPAVNGVAAFSNVAIDLAGFGYTLSATSGTLPAGGSAAFDVGGVIAEATSLGLKPVDAAFSPASGFVCVPGANRALGVLDTSKVEITQFFSLLQGDPFGVAVNEKTNRLYISTIAGIVVAIECRIPPEPQPPILLGGEARGIAVDTATDRIFVAVAGDPPSLAIIDGKDNQVIGGIPMIEGIGSGVAFNQNDRLVYVAIPAVGVAIFDPEAQKHDTTVLTFAAGTHGVAVDVRKNLIYATNSGDRSMSVIDPVERKEIHRVQVGDQPEGLGVDADRGVVYVANSGSGTISFIETGSFTVFATLFVGPTPKAAAVDVGSGRVYVPTFGDDRVRVVQP